MLKINFTMERRKICLWQTQGLRCALKKIEKYTLSEIDTNWTVEIKKDFVNKIVRQIQKPKVIDADTLKVINISENMCYT